MDTTIVVCVQCRRVLAVGARVPALCLALVPENERRASAASPLEQNPAVHRACVEMTVLAPDGLQADELLHQLETLYAEQIGALARVNASAAE